MDIKEILTEIGYNLIPDSKGYRSNALYRHGDNQTALLIYKNGNWVDFVESRQGTLEELIQLTLQLKDINQAKEWLQKKDINIIVEKPELKLNEPKTFPIEWIESLKPDHSYWMGRGISEGVLTEFKGGVWTKETMFKDYYVFPVFDCQNRLVGLAGRNINSNSSKPKWKLKGEKKYWKYPLFLNHQYIKNDKKVLLVESIGNCLALWEAGYKNIIVMFGIDISFELINYFLKFDIYNIIISTDHDGKAGIEAAKKIYRKLGKYFDKHLIKIIHPFKKDFGDQTKEENLKWLSNANVLPK